MTQLSLTFVLVFVLTVKGWQTLNIRNICGVKNQVAFCHNRVTKGTYEIEGDGISRIVFSRVDSVGVTFVLGRNTPQLSSIIIKIGGCPSIESKDNTIKVIIEALDIKCHVSNRVRWDKKINTFNSIWNLFS